jgi:hypothetical protein
MSVKDLVLVRGLRDTRIALARWNRSPGSVLLPWLGLSLLIAAGLLVAVYVIAELSRPDPSFFFLPGFHSEPGAGDFGHVLFRNSLVLALHALACVAGFMAGSSLPFSASQRTGLSRRIHEKAGPLAIGFVVCATTFSLATQAYVIGGDTATVARQLDISPAMLVLSLLPHALPELAALFLPLAAWLIASRHGDWHELLAATFVTVAIAVPVLLGSAAVELYVSPGLLEVVALP